MTSTDSEQTSTEQQNQEVLVTVKCHPLPPCEAHPTGQEGENLSPWLFRWQGFQAPCLSCGYWAFWLPVLCFLHNRTLGSMLTLNQWWQWGKKGHPPSRLWSYSKRQHWGLGPRCSYLLSSWRNEHRLYFYSLGNLRTQGIKEVVNEKAYFKLDKKVGTSALDSPAGLLSAQSPPAPTPAGCIRKLITDHLGK